MRKGVVPGGTYLVLGLLLSAMLWILHRKYKEGRWTMASILRSLCSRGEVTQPDPNAPTCDNGTGIEETTNARLNIHHTGGNVKLPSNHQQHQATHNGDQRLDRIFEPSGTPNTDYLRGIPLRVSATTVQSMAPVSETI